MNIFRFLPILLLIFSCTETPSGPGTQSQTPPVNPVVEGPPLVLSILPVERAGALYERFLPLRYYLESELGRPVEIRVSKDFETVIREIGTGVVHLAFLDPATYCEVRKRYGNHVVPLVRARGISGASSRSVFVVKTGSQIDRLADLTGKKIAFGNRNSSFSYLIPFAMLNDVGIAADDLTSIDYLQQEDRVALSVLVGDHDAGALSESVALGYLSDGLTVIRKSEAIPRFTVCASASLDADLRGKIISALVSIRDRVIPASIDKDTAGFEQTRDRDFDMVRVMIRNVTGENTIEYGRKTIRVAILPLYSAITLYDRYDPLMRYLTRKTGFEFKLVIPRNFEEFERIVSRKEVDFSYQNPYIFATIDKRTNLMPLVTTVTETSPDEEQGDRFRGVIITRTDGSVQTLNDLRKKKVMITSPMSAGGYLSQRIFLLKHGIDTNKDLTLVDAKRHERVILGVYRGEADAGFVRESALAEIGDVVDMSKIHILARTSRLPNWPFALCRNVDPALVKQVRELLIGLNDPDILRAARIRAFKPVDERVLEELKSY